MSTATLTKPETTVREDGISGYAVAMARNTEASNREPVQIVTYFINGGMELGIDRVVTLHIEKASERIGIFSERGIEMITIPRVMGQGHTVTLYPIEQHPGHTGRESGNH